MNKPQETPGRSTGSPTKDDRTQRAEGNRSRDELDETSGRHASPRTDEDRETGGRSRHQH
ncbi:MAG TPA: hypothetical protein VN851_17985 [Thermoanaerobaculia bacterium]|nr:hypothetical protein [Thermoanaerobaculia bacterium]